MTKLAIAPALIATAALFVITAAGATPAAAATAATGQSATIEFADLDLMSEAGQKKLDRRIEKTARAVCGMDAVTTGSRMVSRSQRECYDQALRSARSQVAAAVENSRRGG